MIQKHSHSERRVKVKTPGGRVAIHYRPRKKAKLVCSRCSGQLHGIGTGAASKKNPSRPYAGMLCSRCSRAAIKETINA